VLGTVISTGNKILCISRPVTELIAKRGDRNIAKEKYRFYEKV
jgi:hypothetical protein